MQGRLGRSEKHQKSNFCGVLNLLRSDKRCGRFGSVSSPRVELSLAGIFVATSPLSLPYLHQASAGNKTPH